MVHRTGISEDRVFILQLLRDQLGGNHLYPAHRLDRGTSGVLFFGKSAEAASRIGTLLMDRSVQKIYHAIVRGWVPLEDTVIDYPLEDKETQKEMAPAVTRFKGLEHSLIDAPIGLRYPTARFSLVEISPETGRRHQIRKHFAHIRNPVIGDTRHGDVKQNKYFKINFDSHRMFLHASQLSLLHPFTQEPIHIQAPWDEAFEQGLLHTKLNQP